MKLCDYKSNGGKGLIGMVHCLPLPGTFRSENEIHQVIDRAVSDARILEQAGFDALIVENEDKCTALQLTRIQETALSIVAMAVRDAVRIPVGLSCGSMNYEFAFSLARVAGLQFIRQPIFVDTVMNYNGIITPCSQKVVLMRKTVGAENVDIFADVHVKHYFMLNPEIPISTSARWAANQGADAIIVSGQGSGLQTSMSDLKQVRSSVTIPVVVGSGICEANIREQLATADLLIVGSALRKDGNFTNPIDPEAAARMVHAAG